MYQQELFNDNKSDMMGNKEYLWEFNHFYHDHFYHTIGNLIVPEFPLFSFQFTPLGGQSTIIFIFVKAIMIANPCIKMVVRDFDEGLTEMLNIGHNIL